MRIECGIEGLEENWIEFEAVWTRKEIKEWDQIDAGEPLLAFIRRKATGCHLARPGLAALTDPADLTEENLDLVDLRLVEFVGSAPTLAAYALRALGKLSGRPSSATFADRLPTKTLTTQP